MSTSAGMPGHRVIRHPCLVDCRGVPVLGGSLLGPLPGPGTLRPLHLSVAGDEASPKPRPPDLGCEEESRGGEVSSEISRSGQSSMQSRNGFRWMPPN